MFWTLSARLFLVIAVVTLACLGVLAWLVVEIHTVHLEEEMVEGSLRLSDTLRRSTRYSMLKNRKEDVYEIIRAVGAQPGIERIRIFNKEGEIQFSTHHEEQGKHVDTRAEACTHCHTDGRAALNLKGEQLTRIFKNTDGIRVMGMITPVYNEPSCKGASCHVTPEAQQILGVLDVQMSLEKIDHALKEQNNQFFYLTYFLMLVIASICGIFLWRFVHVPVTGLIRSTQQIASGNLDHRIPVQSRTEIGHLAQSFNQMAEELNHARQQVADWNRTLEQRVEEKTQMLQQAQQKLIQNEKMASLGSLSATVAHEINNPLSGVLTYVRLMGKILQKDGIDPHRLPDLRKYLDTMGSEIARCGKVVGNLLEFSRQSDMAVGKTDVNAVLKKTLFLIAHKLELQGIQLVRDLHTDLPTVVCDADQIQQAILAILINAVEAMPEGGELKVVTRPAPDEDQTGIGVEVEITDTGVGIPEKVLPRLFEPFFTTKQDKKGVGLGLSIVYGIIKRHRGRMDVKSEEGYGTTFVLALPEHTKMRADPDAVEALPEGPRA